MAGPKGTGHYRSKVKDTVLYGLHQKGVRVFVVSTYPADGNDTFGLAWMAPLTYCHLFVQKRLGAYATMRNSGPTI